MIEDPISKILLKNNIQKGETLIVKSVNDKIKISLKSNVSIKKIVDIFKICQNIHCIK